MMNIAHFSATLLLLTCLACAPTTKQPVTLSATGFAMIDPKLPAGVGRNKALKLAELNAREQLKERVNMYRFDNNMPLQQLTTVDPFVRAVVDDTIRSARISDRTEKGDGTVSAKVELNMDQLASMLGKPVGAPAQTEPQLAK